MPDEAEAHGLHALLLLQDARRDARLTRDGELVAARRPGPRAAGTPTRSSRAAASLERAHRRCGRPGRTSSRRRSRRSTSRPETDWEQIALLYDRLAELAPSPVVELNRAVAVAMARGPEAGLALLDAISGLDDYYLWHAARADFLRRLGRPAAAEYERAVALAPSAAERDFLRGRQNLLPPQLEEGDEL